MRNSERLVEATLQGRLQRARQIQATLKGRLYMGIFVLVLISSPFLNAQGQRPRAELAPSPATTVAAGSTAKVTLAVRLPKDVHVQADKPRDPSLIATALTVRPPDGVTVQNVTYPKPEELAQAGRSEPLLVLGPEFVIEVALAVGTATPLGHVTIPVRLRYQACNDSVCFPPATATAEWTLTVK